MGRTLGFGMFKSIRTILFPLLFPALLLGGGLVFIQSMSDWGTAAVLSVFTSSVSIHELWFSRGTPVAAVQYSLVIVVILFTLLLLSKKALKPGQFSYLIGVTDEKRAKHPSSSRVGNLLGLFLMIPIVLGFFVPFFSVGVFFIESLNKVNLTSLYSDVFTTVTLIVFVCFSTTIVALYLGFTERRVAGRIFGFATQWISSAYMIPSIVFVLGVLVLTNHNFILSRYGDLTSFTILFFALTVRYVCFIYIPIKLAFMFLPKRVDELGRSMNLSPVSSFFKIHLPQLNGFVLFGSFLIIIQLLKELTVTLSLHPFGHNTLALRIFTYSTMDMFHESTGFIVAMVILGIYPLLVIDTILSRTREA
jgi:iron(III) transport system permease protein